MVRSTERARRRTRRVAAALVGMALIAAACSDKQNDDAVGEEADTTDAPAPVTTEAAPETTEADTATTSADTTDDTDAPETTTGDTTPAIAVQSTLPPPFLP